MLQHTVKLHIPVLPLGDGSLVPLANVISFLGETDVLK